MRKDISVPGPDYFNYNAWVITLSAFIMSRVLCKSVPSHITAQYPLLSTHLFAGMRRPATFFVAPNIFVVWE